VPLWLDELNTYESVTQGLGSHSWEPPALPYYALVHVWTLPAPTSDLWLRLPSMLAASLAAVLTAGGGAAPEAVAPEPGRRRTWGA
jgi:uncharacterized membrane protein